MDKSMNPTRKTLKSSGRPRKTLKKGKEEEAFFIPNITHPSPTDIVLVSEKFAQRFDDYLNHQQNEDHIEITERARAKTEAENDGTLPQNWKNTKCIAKCLSIKQTLYSPNVMD